MVLVDALAIIMGHEERELCKPGHLGLVLIVDTATALLGSREMVRILCEMFIFVINGFKIPKNLYYS